MEQFDLTTYDVGVLSDFHRFLIALANKHNSNIDLTIKIDDIIEKLRKIFPEYKCDKLHLDDDEENTIYIRENEVERIYQCKACREYFSYPKPIRHSDDCNCRDCEGDERSVFSAMQGGTD